MSDYKKAEYVTSYESVVDKGEMAYPAAAIPTPENSKRKTDSSQLPANQDSPAPVGDACC